MGFLDRFFGGVPDQKTFGAMVVDYMKKSGEKRPITFEEQRFQIVVGNPGEAINVLWLGNGYEEFKVLPKKDRDGFFQRYHPSTYANVDAFDHKESALHSLLPRIRDRLYPNVLGIRTRRQLGAAMKEGAVLPSLPHRALGEVLAASLCIDLPTTVMDCIDQNYTRWNASLDELWPQALENLRAISKKPFNQPAPGVYVSSFMDSHDPARLLLPELIASLKVKGAPVAGAPNRNTLIVTGSNDPAGLNEFVTLMKMGLKDPRPISSMPLVLGPDGWVPFEPKGSGPVEKELRILAAQCWAGLHDDQKETLTEEFERTERDVFVASYKVVMNQAGEVITYASWTEGVPTLLPKTTDLMLTILEGDSPENADVTRVAWDDVIAIAGHRLVEEPGLWPPRWHVTSFPNEEEMTRLRAKAK